MFRLERARTRQSDQDAKLASGSIGRRTSARPEAPAGFIASPALEWLWNYLNDVGRPHVLDCGSFQASTAEILLRRCGKFYVADLMAPLLKNDSRFWQRSGKTQIFRTDDFLAQLPNV